MTPKEKAKELVDKFSEYSHTDFNYSRGGYQLDSQLQNAIQCALIAVDEIIELYEFHVISNPDDKRVMDTLNYFDEVKQEIEKL